MKKILLAAAVMAAAASASANGFRAMAKELSWAAKDGGALRVAVLPFKPADSSRAKEGLNLSDKLITQLAKTGRVRPVEREQLGRLMEEHRLARSGAMDASTVKKLGRLAAADAVVVGSFVTLGRDAVVNARLIRVETGEILGAVERRVRREAFDLPGLGAAEAVLAGELVVPAPEFLAAVPPLPQEGYIELRDSPADSASDTDSCADAPRRVDALEAGILDLKARFWALRLKKGFDRKSLTVNPGSTISNPELRGEFYAKMKEWYARAEVPELSPYEVKRFIAQDQRAYSLYKECGL